jgi:oligopeptide/dipeptide ABC transporter ATP-binding protein
MSDGLRVRGLQIDYHAERPLRAIDGVDLDVAPGETVGLVGESGCGKSTLARSLIGMLARNGERVGGSIEWNGRELTTLSARELAAVRWREIALVPQSSMNSLNPVYRVGDQIEEIMRVRGTNGRRGRRAAADARAVELCELVGIDPARLRSYPHQLSGGMRQRFVLAMALALRPGLVIADEPTTGLDVIVQDRILRRIAQLQEQEGFAMILVTHDIGAVAETCRRVVVMYAGKVVEVGPVRQVFAAPGHPYTMGLKNAFPDLRRRTPLVSIPGHPPSLERMPQGCRFASRCPFATAECTQTEPPLRPIGPGQIVACHHADRAAELRERSQDEETWWAPEAVA